MNAADYILPADPMLPNCVAARFPAEFVRGDAAAHLAIMDECLKRHDLARDSGRYSVQVSNLRPGDFESGMLSMRVWCE